jgi:hypothetical protein
MKTMLIRSAIFLLTAAAWTIVPLLSAQPVGGADGDAIGAGQPETRSVPYLGVGTAPVDGVLGAELGLAEGVGLKVIQVDAESNAAHRIQFDDVLHTLDDQILVNSQQLRVLIRMYEPGDDVRVRLFRGGVPMDVPVIVGSKDVPANEGQAAAGNAVRVQARPGGEGQRIVGGITVGDGGTRTVFRFGGQNAGTSTVTRTEGDKTFSLETTTTQAKKLTVTDKDGEVVFDGPVTTPEQREAVPEDLKRALDKLDGPAGVGMGTVIQIQTQGAPGQE